MDLLFSFLNDHLGDNSPKIATCNKTMVSVSAIICAIILK